jgi:Domain of unknown function (DUF4355)
MNFWNLDMYKYMMFDAGAEGGEGGTDDQENKKEDKTYTKEEMTEKIDKAVAKTIAKERAKWEEELRAKEQEKEEEKKLAEMSAEERAKAEFEKEKIKFEAERKSFERERLLNEAKDALSDLGIPREFAGYLLAEDKTKTLSNINKFKEEFDKAVQSKVDEKFKENGRNLDDKQISTERNPFAPGPHYNLTEQGRLFKEDPERAKALQAAARNK